MCFHGKVGTGLDCGPILNLGNLTIPVNLTNLRIIQSTSSRICELANHRVTVKWKEFHLVYLSNPYSNPNLTPVHGRKGINEISAISRTNLLTQWLRLPVKCCLWITEWPNRVRVTVMVKVGVSVTVVVRARVLSASTCLPTECSANLQSAFYPWPVVVWLMLAVSTYRHIHTC